MNNLAFIHENFISSLFSALEVAEKMKVKVATFPDLVKMRINNDTESFVWNRWLTPLTTIYLGKYQDKRLIVVAHHLGPLTTKERMLEWSVSGNKDEGSTREKYGYEGLPKVTQQEFNDLVEGKFGEVTIIDFEPYRQKFLPHLKGHHVLAKNALRDPVLRALFGVETEEYVAKHLEISTAYAIEGHKEVNAGEKIFEFGLRDRYGWHVFTESKGNFPDEQPIGLFLTFGNPSHYANHDLSISTEIRTHEDLGYARFVVLNSENGVSDDIMDVDFNSKKHWKQCLVKSEEVVPDFFILSEKDKQLFTVYPKDGNRMDDDQIMFKVTHSKRIGKPTSFKTLTYGSPFLKYHIDEVKVIAPVGANAYMICGDIAPGEIATVPVKFYKVEIDQALRVLRDEEVINDLPLLLKINDITV